MAGYNIVLNLSGNAVTRSQKLALNLERANVAAKSLAATMPALNRGINSLNSNSIIRNYNTVRRNPYASNVGQTRHPYTRIGSYGYGFNIGGFSGRLSTILQPDANGRLLGMNAGKLMRAANITAIATSLMSSIGSSIYKIIKYTTIAPTLIGGGILALSMAALNSESFAEGVRLISRRHQSRLGLGAEYEQANINTDYLASTYGLDRSTTLSSINVMTGLGVGGSNRKINLAEATDLTKIGGIISQHHGVPFERVMTNIQQLLVQDKPNLRDIRELLNQAPILGKYALKEMESRNIKGVDVRTYLKDQGNILSVLKSYEMDTATNAGMQARGVIGLAKQDAWAKIASNDPFWGFMGDAGAKTISSIGGAVNNIMTTLVNNSEFRVMVKNIEMMFDNLGTKGATFIDKLISLVDAIASKYGIDLGNKRKARYETDVDDTIRGAVLSDASRASLRKLWDASGNAISKDPSVNDKAFDTWIKGELVRAAAGSKELRSSVVGVGSQMKAETDYTTFQRWNPFSTAPNPFEMASMNAATQRASLVEVNKWKRGSGRNNYFHIPKFSNYDEPSSLYASYMLDPNKINEFAKSMLDSKNAMGKLDPSLFANNGASGEGAGSDLRGFNRDRRSLEIHFHDKIVEWNSNISASNPKEILDEIAVNIEQITSAGIQKAMLGASGKAGTRWY